MKRIFKFLFMIVSLIILVACGKDEKKEITVYSCFEEDYISSYIEAFNKEYPDIKINLIRDSSGVIAAKFDAEKNNPQADVLWGVAATGILNNENYFEPVDYNLENINSLFYDNSKEVKWVGISAWMTAFSYNKLEGNKSNLKYPLSYEELLDSKYKGQIVMPNPASSGTGFLTVSAWIQSMGEEKAWDYMDKLNENIRMYVHSGSAPTKMASQGETLIGIGMGFEGLREKNNGMPIEVIFPKEGSGWEMEIVGLVKKSEIKSEAKVFAEWAISEKAMRLYAKNRGLVTNSKIKPQLNGYPENINSQMLKNNLVWAAENRDRILKEWERRYGKGEN